MALIVLSFVIILAVYVYISIREKSFINVYTPQLAIFLPANYILVYIFNTYKSIDIEYSIGFVYVYVSYLLFFTISMIVYTFEYKIRAINLPSIQFLVHSDKLKVFSIFFFFLSIIIYLPILYEYKEYLLHPREIYTHTRNGGGIYYFSSIFFMNIAFILSLFAFKKYFFIFLFFLILAFLHGSKGVIIWGGLVYLLFQVYFLNKKFSLIKSIAFIIIFVLMMFGVFLTTFTDASSVSDLILKMASYSDYTRNAIKLIDNYDEYFSHYWNGQLLLEDNIYNKLPRILYEDKPRAFGSLRLAASMYPEWFSKNVGDASFGLVGRPFADFGYLSIFYLIVLATLQGFFLKICVQLFKRTQNIFYFIMLLFFSGLGLISLGLGYLFVTHLFIAFALTYLITLTITTSKEKAK